VILRGQRIASKRKIFSSLTQVIQPRLKLNKAWQQRDRQTLMTIRKFQPLSSKETTQLLLRRASSSNQSIYSRMIDKAQQLNRKSGVESTIAKTLRLTIKSLLILKMISKMKNLKNLTLSSEGAKSHNLRILYCQESHSESLLMMDLTNVWLTGMQSLKIQRISRLQLTKHPIRKHQPAAVHRTSNTINS